MWLAELHTAPERSVLAAPLNIASAIATRTKRMKIGIAVQVLPLCHPLRIAEEATTVDHISHGRLIFGVGRSGFPRTYQAYGISYAESRERFAEVLEILKRAWTQETFSFHGQFYLKSKIVVGTPTMVADRLAELKATLGLSGILAEMNCGMRIPHDRVVRSLRLMCSKVMPHLRD
jgi:alkanesulfonate monooxygenase SsuD/methylene tetrahydromethanopterin reductase-like flavin-dependent oxidoreductase (luciferase family)